MDAGEQNRHSDDVINPSADFMNDPTLIIGTPDAQNYFEQYMWQRELDPQSPCRTALVTDVDSVPDLPPGNLVVVSDPAAGGGPAAASSFENIYDEVRLDGGDEEEEEGAEAPQTAAVGDHHVGHLYSAVPGLRSSFEDLYVGADPFGSFGSAEPFGFTPGTRLNLHHPGLNVGLVLLWFATALTIGFPRGA